MPIFIENQTAAKMKVLFESRGGLFDAWKAWAIAEEAKEPSQANLSGWENLKKDDHENARLIIVHCDPEITYDKFMALLTAAGDKPVTEIETSLKAIKSLTDKGTFLNGFKSDTKLSIIADCLKSEIFTDNIKL